MFIDNSKKQVNTPNNNHMNCHHPPHNIELFIQKREKVDTWQLAVVTKSIAVGNSVYLVQWDLL